MKIDPRGLCPDETETKPRLDSAQVQSGQVRRAEGTHIQTAVVLMGLADVGCHHTVGVVEAAGANAAIVHLRHQTVARNELHQNVLTEELWRKRGSCMGALLPAPRSRCLPLASTLKRSFLIQGRWDRKSSMEKPGLGRTADMATQ